MRQQDLHEGQDYLVRSTYVPGDRRVRLLRKKTKDTGFGLVGSLDAGDLGVLEFTPRHFREHVAVLLDAETGEIAMRSRRVRSKSEGSEDAEPHVISVSSRDFLHEWKEWVEVEKPRREAHRKAISDERERLRKEVDNDDAALMALARSAGVSVDSASFRLDSRRGTVRYGDEVGWFAVAKNVTLSRGEFEALCGRVIDSEE